MTKRNKKNNFSKFVQYSSLIILITSFFVSLLTIKNECISTQHNIEKLHRLNISNSNIVKELQSNKELLMSENYINSFLSDKMTVVTPETLVIYIK